MESLAPLSGEFLQEWTWLKEEQKRGDKGPKIQQSTHEYASILA